MQLRASERLGNAFHLLDVLAEQSKFSYIRAALLWYDSPSPGSRRGLRAGCAWPEHGSIPEPKLGACH
jgi:hypothetical protein